MSAFLEKSLDEIIGSNPSSRGPRRNKGNFKPKGHGVRKNHHNNRPDRRRQSRPVIVPTDAEAEELSGGNAYLRVTNLHPEITEKELLELFSKIGELSFCKVKYNTQGESLGVAFVGYKDPSSTFEAIDKFDGRKAAGQVITVENAVPLSKRIAAAGRGNRSRNPLKNNHIRKAKKSVDDLDAELSAYMGGSVVQENNEVPQEQQPEQQSEQQPEQAQDRFPSTDVMMD